MKWKIIVCVFLLASLCWGKDDILVPSTIDDFPDIKDKCDKNGKMDTYDRLKDALEKSISCVQDTLDISTVQNEIEESRKTGSMDEVFGKYCRKRSLLRECVKETVNVAKECLEPSEVEALNITGELVEKIVDFACYRDGDRLAMFVAEGGVECLKSRIGSIKDCVNKTLKFGPLSANSISDRIPSLTLNKQKYQNIVEIQECIVKDLEDHCTDNTPANIVDSLFEFVKKSICKEKKEKRSIKTKLVKRTVLSTFQFYQSLDAARRMCERVGSEEYFRNYSDAFDSARSCGANQAMYLASTDQMSGQKRIFLTSKNELIDLFTNCSAPFFDALEDCLLEDEKYFRQLVSDMGKNLIGFVYDHSKDFRNISSDPNVSICFGKLKDRRTMTKIEECKHKSGLNNEARVPPKLEYCQKFGKFVDCTADTLKEMCELNTPSRQFIDEFKASIEKPCKNETQE